MLKRAWPVNVECGRERIAQRTQQRAEERAKRVKRDKGLNWATVLSLVGERIVWWLSAVVSSPRGTGFRPHDILRGSSRGFVAKYGGVRSRGGQLDRGGQWFRGGQWSRSWLRGESSPGRRNDLFFAGAFFVGVDEVSEQAAAEGPAVVANRQTLRNREGCQLGQWAMWLKRYKTGMFANLANLAKQICEMLDSSPGSAIPWRKEGKRLAEPISTMPRGDRQILTGGIERLRGQALAA